jgi:hypothetical protein
MKFDPALKDAVCGRAPAGVTFDPAEVEQALRWAFDVRASGRLDGFYRGTALGDAALDALAAYRPAGPRQPGTGDVVLRLALFALAGMIPTLALLGVLAVLVRVAGGHVGINRWGLLVAYVAWLALGWLVRDRIKLFEPIPNRYASPVPAQRSGEADPIAVTMTDPDLQPRPSQPDGTERATR